jgi:putative NADH-flavin reductase
MIENMKTVLLLGATGRTGRHVLSYALDKGFLVKALVRDPEKVPVTSDRLELIAGTPVNLEDVRKAIAGCDSVISTLNNPRKTESLWARPVNPPDLMTGCMRNALTAMKEKGIRRIIVQTGAGAGDSFASMPLFMKALIRFTGLRYVYADHDGQEKVLKESGLDWTIVRPVGLTDKEEIRELAVGSSGKHSPFVSRKAVARFLVDCLESSDYIRQAPTISEKK